MVFNFFLSDCLIFFSRFNFLLVSIPFIIVVVEICVCEFLHGVVAHVAEGLDSHKSRLDVSPDERSLNMGQDFIMGKLKPLGTEEISSLLFSRQFMFVDHSVLLLPILLWVQKGSQQPRRVSANRKYLRRCEF